jgi:hypothetical protein
MRRNDKRALYVSHLYRPKALTRSTTRMSEPKMLLQVSRPYDQRKPVDSNKDPIISAPLRFSAPTPTIHRLQPGSIGSPTLLCVFEV